MPPCPWLEVTGVPCPLCGATRAFSAAARGDLGAVLEANAVWVLWALLAAVGLVVLALVPAARAPLSRVRGPRAALAVLAALALPAWTWALAHQDTIAG